MRLILLAVLIIIIFGLGISLSKSQTNILTPEKTHSTSFNARINQPFFGDLEQIRQRRVLRVLVSYNRTHFFMSDYGTRGLEYEFMKSYENYLNRGPLKERFQTHIVFIIVPFNELIDHLIQGHGDIIAAGLTITPGRAAQINFTHPYITQVNEILVSHKRNSQVTKLEELSGEKVIVVSNSSYIANLEMANVALSQAGLKPMEIVKAPSLLDAEDVLELVNAEIYDYTVVDNHLAKVWQNTYNNLEAYENFIFHHAGNISWAVRKENPKLQNSLNAFANRYAKPGSLLRNVVYKRYFESSYWVSRPLTSEILQQASFLKPYFQLYSDFYDLDWFLMTATAYQESRFEHQIVSNKGARGIMQIKPSTAKSPQINIPDISDLESNIHAGIKYMAHLRDHYFGTQEYTDQERVNFMLAAYNAGPSRVRKLQRLAEQQGLDPYKWFYNVEQIARSQIGQETVNYVTSIQKHKLLLETAEKIELEKNLARQELNF